MRLAAVGTTGACVCLLFALCDAIARQFTLAGQNSQFKSFGTLRKLKLLSLTQCTVECLNMGNRCGSFSFTKTKLCTINVMRIQAQHVQLSQLFDVENGTHVYRSESGDFMPHGNVAVKETANYSYLLSLKLERWYEAFEFCQQFGYGFYLANIDDAEELDSLRPWLSGAPTGGQIWVSGTNKNHEDCWVWAAPVITNLTDHTMWGTGQPNGWESGNCMLMYRTNNWKFSHIRCYYFREYLCKRAVNRAYNSFPTVEQAWSTDIC